jgi:hypothetical protein
MGQSQDQLHTQMLVGVFLGSHVCIITVTVTVIVIVIVIVTVITITSFFITSWTFDHIEHYVSR